MQAGCFAFLKSFSCFSNARKKIFLISNIIPGPLCIHSGSACLNGTHSLGPVTACCLMSGDSQQCEANHTEELLKSPSQRARYRDRQQRSLSSTGKHLAALSLESGEMKAPRCTSRQLQGAPEPILVQRAVFPEWGQGGVTLSESTQVTAYLLGSSVASSLGCPLGSCESSPL